MTGPVVAALLTWADDFEAGRIDDPAVREGALEAGERVAVRIGPVVEATLAIAPVPTVAWSGATGTLLGTDRRVQLLGKEGVLRQWRWATDIAELVVLRDGLGVQWSPTEARWLAGATRLEGLVVPALVRGQRLKPAQIRATFPEFMKVQAAWRASQPGGLAAWVAAFRERYDRDS